MTVPGDTTLAAAILALTFAAIEYWKRSMEKRDVKNGNGSNQAAPCPLHGTLSSELHEMRADIKELMSAVSELRSDVAVLQVRKQ